MSLLLCLLCFLIWAVCSSLDDFLKYRQREHYRKNPPVDRYKEINDKMLKECDEAMERFIKARDEYEKKTGKKWRG